MYTKVLLYIFILGLAATGFSMSSCSSMTAAQERRNLMMPHLSEIPRNSHKFKEPVRKTNKQKAKKKSKKRTVYYSRK